MLRRSMSNFIVRSVLTGPALAVPTLLAGSALMSPADLRFAEIGNPLSAVPLILLTFLVFYAVGVLPATFSAVAYCALCRIVPDGLLQRRVARFALGALVGAVISGPIAYFVLNITSKGFRGDVAVLALLAASIPGGVCALMYSYLRVPTPVNNSAT